MCRKAESGREKFPAIRAVMAKRPIADRVRTRRYYMRWRPSGYYKDLAPAEPALSSAKEGSRNHLMFCASLSSLAKSAAAGRPSRLTTRHDQEHRRPLEGHKRLPSGLDGDTLTSFCRSEDVFGTRRSDEVAWIPGASALKPPNPL
jgi:hypothetical protein